MDSSQNRPVSASQPVLQRRFLTPPGQPIVCGGAVFVQNRMVQCSHPAGTMQFRSRAKSCTKARNLLHDNFAVFIRDVEGDGFQVLLHEF
jgi:hypothetical protein